ARAIATTVAAPTTTERTFRQVVDRASCRSHAAIGTSPRMRTLAYLTALGLALTGCSDAPNQPPTKEPDMTSPGTGGNGDDMAKSPRESDDMAEHPAPGDDLAMTGDMATETPGGDMTPPPPACSYDQPADGTARLLAIYTLPSMSLKKINPYLT